MEFGAKKTAIEVIKEGAFGGTYFRDIYSGINEKWYRKSWKKFDQLKDIERNFERKVERNFIVQIIVMSVSINMVLNAENC